MPALPCLEQPLSDGVAVLRLSAERDIPEVLIAYQDDPALHLVLGERRPPTGAQLGRRAERAPARLRAGEGATLTVLEAGDDVCRGEVRVGPIDWGRGSAELAVWIAPGRRGRGLGRRALRLASAWLLGEVGLERVSLAGDPGNAALLAAARGAGFAAQGGAEGPGERAPGAVVLSRTRGDLPG